MSRVLLRLRKGEQVKYLSHLDLVRAFEFALRRARIPVAYSAGFNPRPRMSFGSAVGVGVTSDDERIGLELASPQEPSDIKEALNSQLPGGLEVLEAGAVPEGVKSPLAQLNASEFRIEVSCEECDPEAVRGAVDELLASAEIRVTRVREGKTKEIDIRPHILSVGKVERADRTVLIEVGLRSGSARPQDFVQALRPLVSNLGMVKIHRPRQFHAADTVGSGT